MSRGNVSVGWNSFDVDGTEMELSLCDQGDDILFR